MKAPRTVWKRHKWSMDWDKLECACSRCGLVVIYRKRRSVQHLRSGAVKLSDRVVEDSFMWKGTRIAYALPWPRDCKPDPPGLRRVG
mgnify:CR=1 FL=1